MANDERASAPLLVTAMGASTCFGGAVTAAAAARARMTRFQQFEELLVRDPETGEMEPLTVSVAASGLTEGFEGAGRVLRLTLDAIEDLRASAPAELPWATVPVFLAVTPPPEEEEEEGEPGQDDEEVPFERPLSEAEWTRALAREIAEQSGLDSDGGGWRLFTSERAGTVRALVEAMRAVSTGTAEHALVVAADSNIDAGRAGRWAEQRKLKTPAQPEGAIPGEAAVALLISRAGSRAHRAPGAVLLHPPLLDSEPSPEEPSGRALATVLLNAAARCRAVGKLGAVLPDLNGETVRAVDFGFAVARLPAGSEVRSAPQVVAAATFGDTGAAAPLLGVLLAARSFQRGYGSGNVAVVLSASDDGTRAAISVQRSN
jgi:3-oxoacyl-[acyl-carrier-protein] synthase-1